MCVHVSSAYCQSGECTADHCHCNERFQTVFVKPHAVTPAVKETVEKKFADVGINVIKQVCCQSFL